jgi:crossover junction endodeoxyribonuclease RuvC
MKRILGLDPGLAETGWGMVIAEGSRFRYLDHGSVRTRADMPAGKRLMLIFDEITALTKRFNPGFCGIEELFFTRNISSALPVAQARGVLLLAMEKSSIETGSYSPTVIKQTLTGSGRASKLQVQEMVRLMLGLPEIPKPDHAADALAAAITHGTYQLAIKRGTALPGS